MEWRRSPTWPEIEVSRCGMVRRNGKLARVGRMSHGYLRVSVALYERETVHTLVAEAFIGPRPEGFDIDHLDGSRNNNHAGNLEYTTRRDNLQRGMYRDKRIIGGTPSPFRCAGMRGIALSFLGEKSQREIAAMFDVGQDVISRLKNGINYKARRVVP